MICQGQRIAIANQYYGGGNPTTLYALLVTGSISDAGIITGEISGGGYARVAIPNNKTTFSTSTTSNEVVRNLIDISFGESTTAWGNITAVGFSDVQSGGTALYYVPVTPAKLVQAFTTVYFKGDPNGLTGNIELSVTN
jgi:hypothetical protein